MLETWKSVVDFEGLYDVSSVGRVRSLDHYTVDTLQRKRLFRGQLLNTWPADDNKHLIVTLTKAGRHYRFFVHVLVATTFIGPCPPGFECCHDDGNGLNNWIGNLRWDTRSNNNYDRARHGTDWARNKTTCPLNHLLQHPNLIKWHWEKRGIRGCLACSRARGNEQTAKRLGQLSFNFKATADLHYAKVMTLGKDVA